MQEVLNNIHYVGLMFEDRFNPDKFYGRVYSYKTTKSLREGQVLYIDTQYGHSKVCVIDTNIPEEEVEKNMKEVGLSLLDVKEI